MVFCVINEIGLNKIKINGTSKRNWYGFAVSNDATALMLFGASGSVEITIFAKYKYAIAAASSRYNKYQTGGILLILISKIQICFHVSRIIVNRYTPMIFGNPIGIWQLNIMAKQPVARLVINLAGRFFYFIKHYIFIVA